MKTTKRIYAIDTLKAFAIVFVILLHCNFSDFVQKITIFPFFEDLAIPIFMVLSGLTWALFAEKGDGFSLKSQYRIGTLIHKLKRILPCYLIIFAVELVIEIIQQKSFGIKKCVMLLVGYSSYPGSYYIPILIELILIFPLCLWLYKRLKEYSFIVVLIFDICYELFINYANVPIEYTRLLIFRYIAFIFGGIWLYYNKDKRVKPYISIPLVLISVIYIVATGYFNYVPKVIFSSWTSTATPTVFLVVFAIHFIINSKVNEKELRINIIGKASYHIYLCQMLLTAFLWQKINSFVEALILIPTCICLGTLFYLCEKKVVLKLSKKIKKSRV